MNIRPFRHIERRKSRKIKVGDVFVGGDAPITVQTMTNTLTTDVDATLEQIFKSVEAGADIIRISCPDKDSTKALKKIVEASPVPIVADIHFHYLRAIEAADAGAACFSLVRLIICFRRAISAACERSKFCSRASEEEGSRCRCNAQYARESSVTAPMSASARRVFAKPIAAARGAAPTPPMPAAATG